MRSEKTKAAAPASYALARGVPALQCDPGRVRNLVLWSVLLALLGGIVTGYVFGRGTAPQASVTGWR